MAFEKSQIDAHPGAFGLLGDIPDAQFVHLQLAVKKAWKKSGVNRSITFEVTHPLPVRIGPIGHQIDTGAKTFLPGGGGTQIELLVPRNDRMRYLKQVGRKVF